MANKKKLVVNFTGLESILLMEKVRNRELVILSIFSGGRDERISLRNRLLQYLESGDRDIISDDDDTLNLNLLGSYDKNIPGIYMWSKPYCVLTDSEKEVAIILIEIQCDRNYEKNFDIILKIQYISKFASRIFNDKEQYQEFIFLIRDWKNFTKYNYGWGGGQKYVKTIMESKDSLYLTFSKIKCFLMPGQNNKKEKLRSLEIDSKFEDEFKDFSQTVFNEEDLEIKKIAGKSVNGSKLFEHFEKISEKINDENFQFEYSNSNPDNDLNDSVEVVSSLVEKRRVFEYHLSSIYNQSLELTKAFKQFKNINELKFCEIEMLDSIRKRMLCIKENNCFPSNFDRNINIMLNENRCQSDMADEPEKNLKFSMNKGRSIIDKRHDFDVCIDSLVQTNKSLHKIEEKLVNKSKLLNTCNKDLTVCQDENGYCKYKLDEINQALNEMNENLVNKSVLSNIRSNDSDNFVQEKTNSNSENDCHCNQKIDGNCENNYQCVKVRDDIDAILEQLILWVTQLYFG